MAEALLALRDIAVRHGTSTVLDLPCLDVHSGEIVVVIGPNGAGKSTLLRVMGLLQRPTLGTVCLHGERAKTNNALAMRRRIVSVFQSPLLLNSTVYANAALGLKLRGFGRDQIDKRLRPWLERFGIAHLSSRHVRTLSGGEAQRTSLARGLALDPDLILLDEPFSALDALTRETLLLDLQEILAETKITTVMVTHDLREAAALGQRIGVLSQGKLLQLAPAREIFNHPVSEAVASIVGMETRIPAMVLETVGGMTTLRFNGGTAQVRADFSIGTPVVLCVRPEDIEIDHRRKPQSCPKESVYFNARVQRVSPSTAHYRVALQADCGPVIALVSKSRFTELALREGDDVLASFNSAAVHVI